MKQPEIEVRLREIMKAKNIKTIGEVSEKTDLSRKAISKAYNKKTQRMPLETVAKLCKGLKCEIGELLVLKKGEE